MLWDYGRMAESTDSAKSAQALKDLLQQDPTRLEVRLEIAGLQLRTHNAKETLATLAPVKTVTPEDAPKLLRLLAYANMDVGDREKARSAAEQWKKVSTNIEDKDHADQILKFIETSRPGAIKPALALNETDAAPALKHRDETGRDEVSENVKPVVRRPSVAGKFVELQCAGERARMVLQTTAGKRC